MSQKIEVATIDSTERYQVDPEQTILDLKKLLIKDVKAVKGLNLNRVGLSTRSFFNSSKSRRLTDDTKRIEDVLEKEKLTSGQTLQLYCIDLGLQVDQKTTYCTAYIGPCVIVVLLALFRQQIYGVSAEVAESSLHINQRIGIFLALAHYLRRELESIFLHNYAGYTIEWWSIPGIMFYYWGLFGFVVMYFFLKPDYKPWFDGWGDEVYIGLAVLFLIFEGLNFKCHLIVAALRKPGTSERGIPKGYGFGLVSSANYWWEGLAWSTFVVFAQTYGALFFAIISWAAMYGRGLDKHKKQIEYFGDAYPKRKIMIPYLL